MVNNIWNILDEGKYKSIDIYKMKDPVYYQEFLNNLRLLKKLEYDIEWAKGEDAVTGQQRSSDLEIKRMVGEWGSLHDPFYDEYMNIQRIWTIKNSPKIAQFMGAMPFYPSVMINISPNWKGMEFNKITTKQFQKVIECYLNEKIGENARYTKWKYCLECGSEGNFLHAHIVAEINVKILESMKSHINRGNHKQQLNKYWDKQFKGKQGLLKGKYSVQRILINTEEILKDKLDYLLEKNKLEGHQNARDLNLVFGDF